MLLSVLLLTPLTLSTVSGDCFPFSNYRTRNVFLNYVVFLIAVCVLAVCSLTAPLPPVVISFPQYDYTANVSTALELLPMLVDYTSITAAAVLLRRACY
jgi:hypothetical protein